MLWLYLLGAVTALIIALRRVLRREAPLNDELYSRKVAIDHVHSGAAWVCADGKIGSMNPALVVSLGMRNCELVGQDWYLLFAEHERENMREAYAQMVLRGIASLDAETQRTDGSLATQNVVLVAVYDHKTRFAGHHCLTVDRTHEKMLERRVHELAAELERLNEALRNEAAEHLQSA
jgi:PAS domain S-box-containing protein